MCLYCLSNKLLGFDSLVTPMRRVSFVATLCANVATRFCATVAEHSARTMLLLSANLFCDESCNMSRLNMEPNLFAFCVVNMRARRILSTWLQFCRRYRHRHCCPSTCECFPNWLDAAEACVYFFVLAMMPTLPINVTFLNVYAYPWASLMSVSLPGCHPANAFN